MKFKRSLCLFLTFTLCVPVTATDKEPRVMRPILGESTVATGCLRLLESGAVHDEARKGLVQRLQRLPHFKVIKDNPEESARWQEEAHRRLIAFRHFISNRHEEKSAALVEIDERIEHLKAQLKEINKVDKVAAQEVLDRLDKEYGLQNLRDFKVLTERLEKLDDEYDQEIAAISGWFPMKQFRRFRRAMQEGRGETKGPLKNAGTERFRARRLYNELFEESAYAQALTQMLEAQAVIDGSANELELRSGLEEAKKLKTEAELFVNSSAVTRVLNDIQVREDLSEELTIFSYMNELVKSDEEADLDLLLLVIQFSINSRKEPPYMTVFDDLIVGLIKEAPSVIGVLNEVAPMLQNQWITDELALAAQHREDDKATLASLERKLNKSERKLKKQKKVNKRLLAFIESQEKKGRSLRFWVGLISGVVTFSSLFSILLMMA